MRRETCEQVHSTFAKDRGFARPQNPTTRVDGRTVRVGPSDSVGSRSKLIVSEF